MTRITSAENPQIRRIRKLSSRKGRRENGLFTAEGERLVREICEPWKLHTLVFADSFLEGASEPAPFWQGFLSRFPQAQVLSVPDALFDTIAETEHPQGVLALIENRTFALEDLLKTEHPFLVGLEDLQDPGNVGTIIRTADAAGASGIILSAKTVDYQNPKTVRSSMGSVFHLPLVIAGSMEETIHQLQERNIAVFAAHLKGSRPLYEADLKQPCMILIGNEGNGLSDAVSDAANERIRIPQPGRSESLNASIAAGIILYEVVRQRLSLAE